MRSHTLSSEGVRQSSAPSHGPRAARQRTRRRLIGTPLDTKSQPHPGDTAGTNLAFGLSGRVELTATAATQLAATLLHDTEALITLIETRFHAVHRRELPDLIRLAQRVEAIHKTHPAAPLGLADLLQRIAWDLEAHMQKEEEGLFPPMRRGVFPVSAAIALMRDDHECHAESLEKVQVLTHHFVVPDEAGPAWHTLYCSTKKLADDLAAHIHIENRVLFPRFVADDSDEANPPGSSK